MLRREMKKARCLTAKPDAKHFSKGKKKTVRSLKERNAEIALTKRFRITEEVVEPPSGKENVPPTAPVGAHEEDAETEDIDLIPHDLLMAAVTKEVLSKLKLPSAQIIRVTKECDLCGLNSIHGNSKANVCRLCKLCVPNPDAVIPRMKLKRLREQQAAKAAAIEHIHSTAPTALQLPLPSSTANSRSSGQWPATGNDGNDDVIVKETPPPPPPARPTIPHIRIKETVETKQSYSTIQVKHQSKLFKYLKKR